MLQSDPTLHLEGNCNGYFLKSSANLLDTAFLLKRHGRRLNASLLYKSSLNVMVIRRIGTLIIKVI